MKLKALSNFGARSKEKEDFESEEEKEKDGLDEILPPEGVGSPIPAGYAEVERYPLDPPYSYAIIAQEPNTLEYRYAIDELALNREEKAAYENLKHAVESELFAPSDAQKLGETYRTQLESILEDHKELMAGLSLTSHKKILYYLERDIVGASRIEPLMKDPYIEDISCGGVQKPLFVWHKRYESIKTNRSFERERELDDFVLKMVHRAGRHVSTAFPVTDITLPGKHRMAVLYRREITPLGSSFTIRKFNQDPYTIIDLIDAGTISEEMGAYLWLLVENRMSLMILGSTAAGKTTALNAITCLVPPSLKIFTVEEVPEINLPHENWFTLISRSGFGMESEGEIGLFDLIKSGVRHRPDYVIVGEVRGEEAYVLFQALATGHGGLCTMHADSIESAIKRLTQKPMNIPDASIPLMKCAIMVRRTPLPSAAGFQSKSLTRRLVRVSEIMDASHVHDVFRWNPSSDTFENNVASSRLLTAIAVNLGVSREYLLDELERRKVLLLWMLDRQIRNYKSVSSVVGAYYENPARVYERATGALVS